MSLSLADSQQVQELCSAALRALARDPALQLRGRRVFRDGVPLPACPAHLQPSAEDGLRCLRGATDGLALRQLQTDAKLHARHAPSDPQARRLFDLLEQYRVEALVPDELAGVRRNLQHRHDAWAEGFVSQGLLDTEQGIVLYTVAQTCRARVTGVMLDDHVQDLMEPVRFRLGPQIGGDVAALRALRHQQAAFAAPAARIANRIAEILRDVAAREAESDPQHSGTRQRAMRLWLGDSGDAEGDAPVAGCGASRLLAGGADAYRVFTRAYDTELDAATLVRVEQLRSLRDELDEQVQAAGVNLGRVARHLQSLFAWPADDGWNSAQEEGRIDGRLLAQLVASPTERRLFKQVRSEPAADCAVTLLLDCSGSMKKYVGRLAVLVDLLARALDQAGITTEVLGFTTGAWNGGRARRDWVRAGRPAHPGRLNEVCHLVFKSAEDSWRRRRRAFAALLKTDYFREGIDGEAVAWACQRLRQRPERRRVLLVVSDGSPMDSATSLANDEQYLDHHLQSVVGDRSATGDVEIRALGVGLDLSPYYAKSLVVDLARAPGMQTMLAIGGLMTGRTVRPVPGVAAAGCTVQAGCLRPAPAPAPVAGAHAGTA